MPHKIIFITKTFYESFVIFVSCLIFSPLLLVYIRQTSLKKYNKIIQQNKIPVSETSLWQYFKKNMYMFEYMAPLSLDTYFQITKTMLNKIWRNI
jgi:hypothetical protein